MIRLEIQTQTGETIECMPLYQREQIALSLTSEEGVKVGGILSLEEANFLIEVVGQYLYSIRRDKDK